MLQGRAELYLQWLTDRKSCVIYRTVPFTITLNDVPYNLVTAVSKYHNDGNFQTSGWPKA